MIFRRAAIVVWIVAIVVLGDLRSPPSDVSGIHEPAGTTARVPSIFTLDIERIANQGTSLDSDVDGVAGRSAVQPDEEGSVVPAIYARDPDVQFVYHRHVSKWT